MKVLTTTTFPDQCYRFAWYISGFRFRFIHHLAVTDGLSHGFTSLIDFQEGINKG